MQVEISILGRSFLTLLDSGSTHNFINHATTIELQLQQVQDPRNTTVAVANGEQIKDVGIHRT